MGKTHKVKVTVEQGQLLLLMSANYQPPEKLGETAFGTVERAQAREEVRMLFRDLKSVSPHLEMPGRKQRLLFGPVENWEEIRDEEGVTTNFQVRETGRECEVRLSEDALSGLLWCLVTYMDPGSPAPVSVMVAEHVVWPLAARLGKVQALREALGLDKAHPRRWKDDPEKPGEEDSRVAGNGEALPVAR